MLYQYDGDSKLSIDVISATNTLRALVKEYLSSTKGSDMLLCLNFVRTKWGHFVTVSSLDDDELFMSECPYFSDRIFFKVEMMVTTTTA